MCQTSLSYPKFSVIHMETTFLFSCPCHTFPPMHTYVTYEHITCIPPQNSSFRSCPQLRSSVLVVNIECVYKGIDISDLFTKQNIILFKKIIVYNIQSLHYLTLLCLCVREIISLLLYDIRILVLQQVFSNQKGFFVLRTHPRKVYKTLNK